MEIEDLVDTTMDTRERMLTTTDNPYDPFTEFEAWYKWDIQAGYHTPGYLARVVVTSDELSDADQAIATNQAIEEILRLNLFGTYRAVEEGEILAERNA